MNKNMKDLINKTMKGIEKAERKLRTSFEYDYDTIAQLVMEFCDHYDYSVDTLTYNTDYKFSKDRDSIISHCIHMLTI